MQNQDGNRAPEFGAKRSWVEPVLIRAEEIRRVTAKSYPYPVDTHGTAPGVSLSHQYGS